jgi:hypothetical protein
MADTDAALAKKLAGLLAGDPLLEVGELAEAAGASQAEVVRVLDSYEVRANGRVRHAGEGRGGGWVPAGLEEETA